MMLRRLLLSVLVILTPVAAVAKDAPVRDRVIAIVRSKMPSAIITPTDALGFDLQPAGRDKVEISIARIADYCSINDAASCTNEIKAFAESIVAMATQDAVVTRERLRVIVRNRMDTDGYAVTITEPGKRPLTRPLFDGVSAVLAADFPKGTRLIASEDLKGLKIGTDDAFALGTTQVLASLPPVPKLAEIDGKMVLISGFDYGASIMLQPERWRALAEASAGRLFVAIPGDGEVLIGTTKSDDDLPKLRELISQEFSLAPRGISSLIYRWSPDGWVSAK